jgi:hypothetical protein
MTTDGNKYKAELLKIVGFSLITPLGKIILNIPDYTYEDINLKFFIFCLLSLVLLYIGIIVLNRGIYMNEDKNYE